MKTWSEVVRDALVMASAQLHAAEAGELLPYCYIYGGNGDVLTEKKIKSLVKTYKSHFDKLFKDTGKTVQDLIDHCKDKRGLDCSEFLWRVTGGPYDMNSTTLFNQCKLTVEPKAGVTASILWKPGHVGLDLGSGMVMEFVGEFRDIQINRIKDRDFIRSGQLPWVDYRGASNK